MFNIGKLYFTAILCCYATLFLIIHPINGRKSVSNKRTSDREVVLVINRLGQCIGKENLTVTMHHMDVVQLEKNIYYLNGSIEIKKDFPKGFRGDSI